MMCICGASFPTPMALYRNCQRDQPPPRLLSPTHAAQQQSSQQPQPQPPPQQQQHVNRRRAVDRERVSCAPKKAASRASRESRVERERAHGRVRATGPRQSHGQKPKTSKGSSQRQPPAHAPSAISDAAPHQPTPSQPAPAPAPTTCPALPCTSARACEGAYRASRRPRHRALHHHDGIAQPVDPTALLLSPTHARPPLPQVPASNFTAAHPSPTLCAHPQCYSAGPLHSQSVVQTKPACLPAIAHSTAQHRQFTPTHTWPSPHTWAR